jgi:hypothetical protein
MKKFPGVKMPKEFNVTGICIPERHYMVDITDKLNQIRCLVEKGQYFTINRPRQYGKTTTLYLLSKALKQDHTYLVLRVSFEGIDAPTYTRHESFIEAFLVLIGKRLQFLKETALMEMLEEISPNKHTMQDLSNLISELVDRADRKVVLIIDEVDKSANNQLFLDFLGMLREKYLLKTMGEDLTFHSVILAGVHDVKSFKLKIRPEDERKYNSPWNIAVDFEIDLSFFPEEILTMLVSYANEKKVKLDPEGISARLFYFTSGYPFLVSKLCKIIDEKLMDPAELTWKIPWVDQAVQVLIKESNTNFENLIKNLENNPALSKIVNDLLLEGTELSFNIYNPDINLGVLYGLFRNERGLLKIHNRIYEQLIYDYLSSKIQTAISTNGYNYRSHFIEKETVLNFERILVKFQEFLKEQYTKKDQHFLEENGRLIFLAFLKPIINGQGFDFKEVQISEEKRLDVVITYFDQKYVVELKIWRGPKAHERGLKQLQDYLDKINLQKGYLIIFDFRKTGRKEWKQERYVEGNKEIFAVWV